MALDEPLDDPKSDLKIRLYYSDVVITIIYGIEALLKILAHGFVWGKKTYLRDPWNVIDFFCLLISI